MKIPFYQTDWNGIDLLELCDEVDHPREMLPTKEFYAAYYKKILAKTGLLTDDWKTKKLDQTEWLKKQIELYGCQDKKILSIGAGTGLVEMPLIESGYQIHLHDWQKDSFNLLSADQKTTCYSAPLNSLPENEYDFLVSIAMTYALDDTNLKGFFEDCQRLLKKDGLLVILDTSISWYEIYSYLRNRKAYRKNCLLWGFKRNFSAYKNLADGLDLINTQFYNQKMTPISLTTLTDTPINGTPHWQMMVFRK